MTPVDICIAGLTFRVSSTSSEFMEGVQEHYEGFCGTGDVVFDVTVVDRCCSDSGPGAGVEFRSRGGVYRLWSRAFVAHMDTDARGINVALRLPDNLRCFDSFLRMAVSRLAPERGGLLVHGAGIVRDGRGFLFAGVSGSGKTSVAMLAGTANVLSDEVVLVQRNGSGFKLCGTPFWGEMGRVFPCARDSEAAGLFLLTREGSPSCDTVGSCRAVTGLMGNVLGFSREKSVGERVLGLCAGFCEAVPVRSVSLPIDDLYWSAIGLE